MVAAVVIIANCEELKMSDTSRFCQIGQKTNQKEYHSTRFIHVFLASLLQCYGQSSPGCLYWCFFTVTDPGDGVFDIGGKLSGVEFSACCICFFSSAKFLLVFGSSKCFDCCGSRQGLCLALLKIKQKDECQSTVFISLISQGSII